MNKKKINQNTDEPEYVKSEGIIKWDAAASIERYFKNQEEFTDEQYELLKRSLDASITDENVKMAIFQSGYRLDILEMKLNEMKIQRGNAIIGLCLVGIAAVGTALVFHVKKRADKKAAEDIKNAKIDFKNEIRDHLDQR